MANPADDLIQLSALIDDELNEVEAGQARQRLAESSKLRSEYRRTRAFCEMLGRWDSIDIRHVAASPSYEAKLLERLRRMRASERRPSSLVISLSHSSRN